MAGVERLTARSAGKEENEEEDWKERNGSIEREDDPRIRTFYSPECAALAGGVRGGQREEVISVGSRVPTLGRHIFYLNPPTAPVSGFVLSVSLGKYRTSRSYTLQPRTNFRIWPRSRLDKMAAPDPLLTPTYSPGFYVV